MDVKNFVCKKCNYRFKRKDDSQKKACPYCGGKNIEEYKPVLAEDFLKNADDF